MAAETFSAEQMLALGIVDAVYPTDSLHAAAQRYAESLVKLAPMAVTNMLEIIRQLEGGNLNREQANALAKACGDSADVQEGITAQREKRAPVFQNR